MKTVLVTGATSGIGLAVMQNFLNLGYRVIGIGHSVKNCELAAARLAEQSIQPPAVFFAADLLQQREVTRVAAEAGQYLETQCGGELYALINNAGCVRSWYSTTEESYEQQFALNHLAGFLLTCRLLPFLKNARGRILFTGSESHKGPDVHWSDVMFKDGYNPLKAYRQSKLCNLLLARELNNRYAAEGIRAYVVDPGLVNTDIGNKQTGGLVNMFWSLRKRHGTSPEIPARTYVFLCEQENPPPGLYYHNSCERSFSKHVTDEGARRLFEMSEQLCAIECGGLR
jgi:NAD(P)-dependent dehydrogenase (short-subunit alcohol dehydrogenase family)